MTNQRGGSIRRREQEQREREGGGRGGGGGGGGGAQASETHPPSSRWNIDGNEIPHSDIEVRYTNLQPPIGLVLLPIIKCFVSMDT